MVSSRSFAASLEGSRLNASAHSEWSARRWDELLEPRRHHLARSKHRGQWPRSGTFRNGSESKKLIPLELGQLEPTKMAIIPTTNAKSDVCSNAQHDKTGLNMLTKDTLLNCCVMGPRRLDQFASSLSLDIHNLLSPKVYLQHISFM